jgi:signal transduction histidine kinase
MPANVHLILHDSIGVISALVALTVSFFVLKSDPRKTVNVTLALTNWAVAVFLIQDIWGASVADPVLSTKIMMWNVSVIFICMFNFHCVMAALHREKEKRALIWLVYALGAAFVAMFLIFPDTFILQSVPKMYLPNYYVPGQFHLAFRVIFQGIIPFYFIYELVRAYRHNLDRIEQNRYLYFAIAFIFGWGLGIIPDLLIYNIRVDPMWGLLFPVFYTVPFTYAVLRYELLDIRVVAKRAFLYAIGVVGVGLMIGALNFLTQWFKFPIWITPIISAVVIVSTALIVWRQLKEADVLKYEFVTTVTHKFRTPLTHIKWAAENLKKTEISEDQKNQVDYIESDENVYQYTLRRHDLSLFVMEVVDAAMEHMNTKKILLVKEISPDVYASFDAARLRFVLQTFLENAINYTPEGGTVTVIVANRGRNAVCSVKDTGIGMSKSELPLIFTKLYRGARARSVDTEGMGIGLFISKGIMNRHRGRIWVESEGENKGSVFSFSLPTARPT